MHTIGLEDSTDWKDVHGIWKRHLGDPPPSSMSVCFVRQGNFTLCEVVLDTLAVSATPDNKWGFPMRAFGIAKRCPRLDTDDPDLARQIAFGRACKALAKEMKARGLAFDRDNATKWS